MATVRLTDDQVMDFHRDGSLVVERLLDGDEVAPLLDRAKANVDAIGHVFGLKDAEGSDSRLSLWTDTKDELYGAVSRLPRIVDRMAQLLGDDVCHFHSKIMVKEPLIGGAWEWHQDYGYWYGNGFLYPHLASCLIALDRATKENGCLQVLRGSHQLGRIDHTRIGTQVAADPARVEMVVGRLERVYCELQPGDALFFHCNTLHRSDPNRSPNPRWSLICCYTTASNQPVGKDAPRYPPVARVAETALREIGLTGRRGQQPEDTRAPEHGRP